MNTLKAYCDEYWIRFTYGGYSDSIGYQRSYGWTVRTAWKDVHRRTREAKN